MEPSPLHKTIYRARVVLLTLAVTLMSCFGGLAFAGEKAGEPPVIEITAKRFEFSPKVIRLKKDVPVKMELRTADVLHGFNSPAMGIRADIRPGMVTKISFTPVRAGTFEFFCDIFCGKGHSKMIGKFIVKDADR